MAPHYDITEYDSNPPKKEPEEFTLEEWQSVAEENEYHLAKARKRLGLGERKMERLFKKNFGVTACHFFTCWRLEAMQGELAKGAARSGEAAARVGWTQSHAAHVFKKVYGRTPSSFRPGRKFL